MAMTSSSSVIEMASSIPLNEAPSSSSEQPKADKLESLARKWFVTRRELNYAFSFSISSLQWLKRNKTFHSALPLFWRTRPSPQDEITSLFDHTSEELSKLIKYYSSEKQLKEKMSKHFSKLIENRGSCHGQSLAILERIRSHPDWNPESILDDLQRKPRQIYYFQVLEIIRGLCNERMVALKETPQKIKPHEEIETCLTKCHTASVRNVLLGCPVSKKKTLFESMQKELSLQENATLIIRCWNNVKPLGHTLLFRCSAERRQYWFYNSAGIGLYEYPSKEALKKGFIDHLNMLIPNSRARTKIYYQLETYSD